ncbi:MAG: NTP transferase domain-containing protein [Xanthomonadales bacterium]|nr:NTP transferase domain-containing protein [Xanthomonadales bacterium]NIN58303.1 NTP transferase domain-containing protein [Xanthomonadales bacterium]NIN73648.1 NTP transferase domain-containing protein [Xanthomonadales bacterium]NIO14433.1 NTP transferase domain-containing protein [Xanthomonadales bacterium]NIP10696.1 NTP transferase domain-containing protein [Xanthomonadales bacterium]
MRAMILAAGRGERLRPLTDRIPKPLVEIAGRPLIVEHVERLAAAGFRYLVVNLAHLGSMIREVLGDGRHWGVEIHYSEEPEGALETGGGILQALPMLGTAPFLAINADIWTRYPLQQLRAVKCDHAHLVLVPGPGADFALHNARVANAGTPLYTFAGMAVYHPRLFAACEPGRFSVVPLLREAVRQQRVTGELFRGPWHDVGTPEALAAACAAADEAG